LNKLTGLIAAPHTPFDANNKVNFAAIDQIAELLVEQGVKGAYVCGTTGEGIHCSVEERKAIAERWVKAADGKLDLILHTGALSIVDTLNLTGHAETLNILATSAIGPCFFKPDSVDDLVEYCAQVAAAAPSKGFYYYHSGISGVNLDLEQFLIKGEQRIFNLSGAKFNNTDLYEYQRCVRVSGGKFDIPFGVDEFLPAGLAVGAVGAVGSTYNYAAPLYLKIIEAFNQSKHDEVAELMDKVISIIRVLVEYGSIAVGKVAMQLHGIDAGDPRPPIRVLSARQKADVLAKLRNANFL